MGSTENTKLNMETVNKKRYHLTTQNSGPAGPATELSSCAGAQHSRQDRKLRKIKTSTIANYFITLITAPCEE